VAHRPRQLKSGATFPKLPDGSPAAVVIADLVTREAIQQEPMTFSAPLLFTNRLINITPVVRLAAKLVGSGPNRLRMVKLSHELREDASRR